MQALQEALQNGSDWLDSADNHKMVAIEIVDGVSTYTSFLDKDSQGQVRFGFKGAKQCVPMAEFINEIIPSLTIEIERIVMRKWKSIESVYNIRSLRPSTEELVFETAPNERQQKEHDDLATLEDLSNKLYKKIF